MGTRTRMGTATAVGLALVATVGACISRRDPGAVRAPQLDPMDPARCEGADLAWKTATKTNYESYPDPGSEECIKYSGCKWAGQFAACPGKKSEAWVKAHAIAAIFPAFSSYELHDICIKAGDKMMVVTAYDTCGDADCDGCCTRNQGDADALIDLEKYTNERWGLPDGEIEWADLGPTAGPGCR